ncbi:hypothetical protein LJC63_09350 [Ruminococcaceae bacterium OttesenSCG-928-L11]|nr:hypothetical protein [Ruminococcaceae bacterium OttesenSCG-928-L11]
MRLPVIKPTDSPEKKAITYILLKNGMRMKDFWEKHSSTRKFKAPHPYQKVSTRLNRSVALTRTVNLLSPLEHTIAIVPIGATVTVESEDGTAILEQVTEKEIVMVTTDEAGYSLTQTSFPAEPKAPREEW